MLWFIIGLMLFAAVMFVIVPLYRSQKKLSASVVVATFLVAGVSVGLYVENGTLDSLSVADAAPDIDGMVASLSSRLLENPDDLVGWKMLGRSYFSMRNFSGAIVAFEKAVALESAQDSQTMSDLGEAVLYSDDRALLGRAGDLFESALVLQPNNPKALFYGGMAAVERGNKSLGADRLEALLATSPPINVQELLRQQIAELRGTSVASISASDLAGGGAPVVTVNVSLGEMARAASIPNTTVFIIARDPAQASPPIAVVRSQVSELPAKIQISDSDAMIPGRVPSGFERLEIVARVSMTGQPIASSADWYGQETIEPAISNAVNIEIDQQVP
jgi:cytochrome c-type biogenesis protein CcmH